MRKIVASVGLVALGASAIQTASGQGLEAAAPTKPWSVSATLRGFYDDNINTASPDQAAQNAAAGYKKDSFGFEVSPAVALTWSLEQTSISLGYLYSLKYYDNEPAGNTDHIDQVHTFNLALSHAFSERYRGSVRDGFVIGQEPDTLRAGSAFSTYQRIPGDNIRNQGVLAFEGDLTRELGFEVGYDNGFYQYQDSGFTTNAVSVESSFAGTLNRIEQTAHLNGLWKLAPETTGVLGYQYAQSDYTGDEPIGYSQPGVLAYSDTRNSRSHYGYLGVNHNFTPALSGSIQAGARYIDFYNNPSASDNGVTPYASLSIRYTYARECFAELGFRYDRNTTDVTGQQPVGSGLSGLTMDETSATVFGTLSHHFTPRLIGNLTAQYQNSTFNGGAFNGESENYYLAGLNFEYRFNTHLSAELGYNYDRLDSGIGRGYDRNRVYLGLTARY